MTRARPWHAAPQAPFGRRAGFSLIEVLAALAITGAMVTVALPYAGRLATRWWVGEATVEAADGWMQALARLEDDLSQALPLTIPVDGKPMAAFLCGDDFVQFVRTSLGEASGASLETVRFEIRTSGAGATLVRRQRLYAADTFLGGSAKRGEPTTLIDGAFRLRFAAIGSDHARQTTWNARPDMPIAIELSAIATSRGAVPPGPLLFPVVARIAEITPVTP